MNLSSDVQQLLCCPICKGQLTVDNEHAVCTGSDCGAVFPVVNGIPVLINPDSSIFSFDDFVQHRNLFFKVSGRRRVVDSLKRLVPGISKNVTGKRNYDEFARLLLSQSANPKVLVLGGSVLGYGMESLLSYPEIELVETDVSFGLQTKLICDGHDLPFGDESFDGVVVQAVLEHVVDPYRCVSEIHRVLCKDGLVYSETPFMQQIHGGPYDFTRFTHLGHRRLFRAFEEIDSGAVCGPGMALAWAYQYFLLSFTTVKPLRRLLQIFARFTSFYLKYFDSFLINKRGTIDAASGFYFIGRKSNNVLPDKELVKQYRGVYESLS